MGRDIIYHFAARAHICRHAAGGNKQKPALHFYSNMENLVLRAKSETVGSAI